MNGLHEPYYIMFKKRVYRPAFALVSRDKIFIISSFTFFLDKKSNKKSQGDSMREFHPVRSFPMTNRRRGESFGSKGLRWKTPLRVSGRSLDALYFSIQNAVAESLCHRKIRRWESYLDRRGGCLPN